MRIRVSRFAAALLSSCLAFVAVPLLAQSDDTDEQGVGTILHMHPEMGTIVIDDMTYWLNDPVMIRGIPIRASQVGRHLENSMRVEFSVHRRDHQRIITEIDRDERPPARP